MSPYYPIMLNLQGKKTVVVGGGFVATRKVKSLLEAEADIVVVSPAMTEELRVYAQEKRLIWKEKIFEEKDVQDAFLIIAATNREEVNVQVWESIKANQLVNIVDRPDLSTFIVPSTVRRGKLIVSVSTSGASPGLARRIGKELSNLYDQAYEDYIVFLDRCRRHILVHVEDKQVRKQLFQELLDERFLELTRKKLIEEREALLRSFLDSHGIDASTEGGTQPLR